MKGILLTSHGLLADGMLDTVKIFSGSPEQIDSLCLLPEEDMLQFLERLKSKIEKLDKGDGVVIFCDLLFGTPCNCSARLLADEQYSNRIEVITGMNLSMVLEFVCSRETGIGCYNLIKAGQDGIVDFNQLYKLSTQSN